MFSQSLRFAITPRISEVSVASALRFFGVLCVYERCSYTQKLITYASSYMTRECHSIIGDWVNVLESDIISAYNPLTLSNPPSP